MKRSEWIDELQNVWGEVNDMNTYFENCNFYEDEGFTSSEAEEYMQMVREEIRNFKYVLNEIDSKLDKMQDVIKKEKEIDEEDLEEMND